MNINAMLVKDPNEFLETKAAKVVSFFSWPVSFCAFTKSSPIQLTLHYVQEYDIYKSKQNAN